MAAKFLFHPKCGCTTVCPAQPGLWETLVTTDFSKHCLLLLSITPESVRLNCLSQGEALTSYPILSMWLGLETGILHQSSEWCYPYEKEKLGHMETMQGLGMFWKD